MRDLIRLDSKLLITVTYCPVRKAFVTSKSSKYICNFSVERDIALISSTRFWLINDINLFDILPKFNHFIQV